jgi:hypothetical protein
MPARAAAGGLAAEITAVIFLLIGGIVIPLVRGYRPDHAPVCAGFAGAWRTFPVLTLNP